MATDRTYWNLKEQSEGRIGELMHDLQERNREIEVLTAERDNALRRIEELELLVSYLEAVGMTHRGGVHPNA